MQRTDLTLHRDRLLALQARLQGDITQMADAALNKEHSKATAMPTDMAELGTDNFIQELTLDLLGNERAVLSEIRAALGRIDDGSFGRCEECDTAISKARLEAIPYAALCVKCASRQEARQAE